MLTFKHKLLSLHTKCKSVNLKCSYQNMQGQIIFARMQHVVVNITSYCNRMNMMS